MIYRSLTTLAGAALDPLARRGGWRARFGRDLEGLPRGAIWLHGASVGEIASAASLAAALSREFAVIATANTPTGRDAALAQGLPAVLAPLDLPRAHDRFLDTLVPCVAVTLESEFWPNRSAALAARGIPQVLAGARLSARSAARWRRLGGLLRPMLARFDAVSAQDEGSEARLLALGLPRRVLLPRVNLKLQSALARPVLPHPPTRLLTLLAASTHAGEEAPVLAACLALRAQGLPLRLILAPRHPQRFDEVARLMTAAGLPPARRSQGADASAGTLLADSMGEMDLWYAAAGLVFTGGSLVPLGGHTPWEPAAQACALLHGPHVANFTAAYDMLDAAGASAHVTAGTMAGMIGRLMADSAALARMGAGARAVLASQAGDLAPLLGAIRRLGQETPLPQRN
ncbi:3-deoxy-D-manno-octulosonic acid transferase [Paracoccus sp. S-4012]|uniref:3-deoxy-D-manno-octulosonic acid transferase n=1 Tax=Paracoccus sp. S-4012 TaxID=2665648 RepID=UPI0012B033BE|nr:glycosyltransferase N-terminal domain-containing protein [Paracoccus sp. S-4012]MRX51449.1 3-deoxy-D-manno-octulosonic acid transferase [Paracoccus sp. S-4012]